jgi:hypothetical protein
MVRFPTGVRFILFSVQCPDRLWLLESLHSYCLQGFFQLVKRPEREADHLPPCSSEEKYAWNYISTYSYIFKA